MKRLAIILATICATPAAAQSITCMPRVALVEALEAKHDEHLTGGGLQNDQHVIEVWTSTATGSFTVFVTRADGVACIIATGQNWHNNALIVDLDPQL